MEIRYNYEDDLITFVTSPSYQLFKKVIRGIYFDNVNRMMIAGTPESLIKDKAMLEILFNMEKLMETQVKTIIEKKKREREKIEVIE